MTILNVGAADEDAVLDKALEKLLRHDAPAPELAEFKAVLDICDGDAGRLLKAIGRDTYFSDTKPGTYSFDINIVVNEVRHKVPVTLHLPKEYTPSKSWPVVAALRSTRRTAGEFVALVRHLLGWNVEKYIIFAPSFPKDMGNTFIARQDQEQSLLAALDDVRRLVNVDDDRIYLTGYGDGGKAVWFHAGTRPRLFAAALAMNGTPYYQGFPYTFLHYMKNAGNLHFRAMWEKRDLDEPNVLSRAEACRMASDEMARLRNRLYIGSEKPPSEKPCIPDPGAMHTFFADKKRVIAPADFVHNFFAENHARGYFIEATSLSKQPVAWRDMPAVALKTPPGSKVKLEDQIRGISRGYARYMFQITGGIDRENNTIKAGGIHVDKLRLYIHAGTLDPDRPVTIRYFGQQWQGKIWMSTECILRHYIFTRDAQHPVVNEVDLSKTLGPIIRYD